MCHEGGPTAENLFYIDVLPGVFLRSDLPSGSHSGDGIDQSPIHVKQTVPICQ